jgi:hypothetical protein
VNNRRQVDGQAALAACMRVAGVQRGGTRPHVSVCVVVVDEAHAPERMIRIKLDGRDVCMMSRSIESRSRLETRDSIDRDECTGGGEPWRLLIDTHNNNDESTTESESETVGQTTSEFSEEFQEEVRFQKKCFVQFDPSEVHSSDSTTHP